MALCFSVIPGQLNTPEDVERLKQAFTQNDASQFQLLLNENPEIKKRINEPIGPFDSPIITQVCSRQMLDVLLEAGADLNAKSKWWAGGFGLLHRASPELAHYAIQRGARVDAHAAARLGLLEKLRELVLADPSDVHAPGGDGQTPLHFASTVEIAAFLLDHGAKIDARDVDHESTPAQHMIQDRQEVVRFLVKRRCRTDLLLASALGDESLVRKHLDSDPASIRMRVSHEHFPMTNPRAGGIIYQWTLGWYVSAHDVAKKFSHSKIYELLWERSPAEVQLLVACSQGNESTVKTLLASDSEMASRLTDSDRRQLAHAARNNERAAVRLMLAAGFPVEVVGQHRATPLHWAAFHGNSEMIADILRYHPPLEQKDADFAATPLGWAIYGSENGWHCREGNYPAAVEKLLQAGAQLGPQMTGGTEPVKAVVGNYRKS